MIQTMQAVDRMIAEMERQHLSTVEMSNRLHLSDSARFSNWKRRGSIPKDQIEPVANALGVSLQWLMTGKGEKRRLSVIQKRVADMMQRNHLVPEDLDLLTRGKVPTATIEHWLDGSADPSDAELKAVAPHLGMPADYFRTGVSAVKYPGGGDRSVIEMPEGYDQASPEARSLAETIIRMSAAGELDEKRLKAISELLGVRRPAIDPAVI